MQCVVYAFVMLPACNMSCCVLHSSLIAVWVDRQLNNSVLGETTQTKKENTFKHSVLVCLYICARTHVRVCGGRMCVCDNAWLTPTDRGS